LRVPASPRTRSAAVDLLDPASARAATTSAAGYLDVLGGADPTGAHPGQRLMASRVLPLIYERLWRPLGARLLLGSLGGGLATERRIALELLDIAPADRVLDVGCGPGNFTREFGRAARDGVVVGLDASKTMLDRAFQEGVPETVTYVRGDASALPFGDGVFDAVCCFAALYLIERPFAAIAEIVRVLAPGGRVALLASANRTPLPAPLVDAVVRPLTGVRMFGRDELTGALRERGLERIEQRVSGLGQFVGARKPAAA
jgi:SAM-dependent methyltransferase